MQHSTVKIFILLLLTVFLWHSPVSAGEDLDKVKQAIIDKNAEWSVGETWVSKLTEEEFARLCGGILEPPEKQKARLLSIRQIDNLPAAFDWRKNDGNWITFIKNQSSPRSCGSCWAFAAVAHIESWWKIANNEPDYNIDLSEQFTLVCSGSGSCDGGWSAGVLDFCRYSGIPLESCLPYEADDQIPCSNTCENWEEQAVTVPGWGFISLENPNIEYIKNALYQQPLLACYTVYEDFRNYTGGIYEHVSGSAVAGHCVLIIGWNDEDRAWICKNSWGTDWGENALFEPYTPGTGEGGFFRIRWGNCDIDKYLAFICEEDTAGPAITVASDLPDLSLIWGDSIVQDLTVTNTGPDTLEVMAVALSGKAWFHPDTFNAWDDSSWWCGIDQIGGYGDMWLQYLETPMLDITGTHEPVLTAMGLWSIEEPFSSVSSFNGFDGCNIWVSVDGGQNFKVANPSTPPFDCQNFWSFTDYLYGWNLGDLVPGWAGHTAGWIPIEVDLAPYISDSLIIRFAFASDPSMSAMSDPSLFGFLVDDILVSDGGMVFFEDHGDDKHNMHTYGIGGLGWLNVADYSATLNPGRSEMFQISVNTRMLDCGEYSGIIRFTSTDPPAYSIDIPCEMAVKTPDHDIALEHLWFPSRKIPLFLSLRPKASIRNCGLNDETGLNIVCSILDSSQVLYRDTVSVSQFLTGQRDTIVFDPFRVSEMRQLYTNLSFINTPLNDYNEFNNTVNITRETTHIVGDFDTDADLWQMEGGWAQASKFRHSGTNSASINTSYSSYDNNMNAIMTLKHCIDLSNAENVTVRYWPRYWTEENKDICYFEASTDSLNWSKLDSISGTGPRTWIQYEVNLSDLIKNNEKKVWIRFHFISDSANTSNGVYIDDIGIYEGTTDLVMASDKIPQIWELKQNYPNPFNPITNIEFQIAKAEFVTLIIYDVKGQEVQTLTDKTLPAGVHQYRFDGRGLASGIYYYRLVAGDYRAVKKMVLLK